MPRPMWEGCCSIQVSDSDERITLEHGEGGLIARRLIEQKIATRFDNPWLRPLGDAAQMPSIASPLAMTTDSFVVSPLFFPGGDIGSLAIHGTVNDLAVAGARPLWLTLSLIIEEGLPVPVLEQILSSAATAASATGVAIVAGDTKVVPRGAADALFITTAGVGHFVEASFPGPPAFAPGDELIVSGPVGRHGIAVLASRESMRFDPPPQSDSASLVALVESLRAASVPVRALRDATRGGVAAVLHEWATASGHGVRIDETAIPISADVRGVCELLGLDALHVACEGTLVAAVEQGAAETAVKAMRAVSEGTHAARIGAICPRGTTPVVVRRALGADQPLDAPLGAPMPRIC